MLDTRWSAARGALITRRRQGWQYDRPHAPRFVQEFPTISADSARLAVLWREGEGGAGRPVGRRRPDLRERHLVGRQLGARVGRDLRRAGRLASQDAENARGLRRPVVEPTERRRGPLRRGGGGRGRAGGGR